MKFRVEMAHSPSGGIAISPDGAETMKAQPCVMDGPGDNWWETKMRPPMLAVSENAFPGEYVFMSDHTHDGTSTFTAALVSALTESAEKKAAELGGDWVISPVIITSEFDHPTRPSRMHERGAIVMGRPSS